MIKNLFFIILFMSSSVFAESVYERAQNTFWRINFDNPPGSWNMGVCWWHSRLQRSIFYLAEMAPDQAKPTPDEARAIVKKLIKMNSVVTIPGYQWPLHFTHDFKPIIVEELSKWQINDSLLNQAWTRGLFRERAKPPEKTKQLMDDLYQDFLEAKKNDEILWVKLQMKPGAHSALILDMIPSPDNTSYKIQTIDSNNSKANTYYSYEKDAQFIFRVDVPSEKSLPWIGFDRDMRSIRKALLKNQKGSQ